MSVVGGRIPQSDALPVQGLLWPALSTVPYVPTGTPRKGRVGICCINSLARPCTMSSRKHTDIQYKSRER